MARAKPDLSPVQAFLEPLARLALRDPMIEALVFWESGGWPSAPAEALEAEEIAFYAEGLLEEGFRLDWRIHARPDAPDRADHVRLYLWEDGAAPPPAPDLPLLSRAIWPEPGA
ncbi:MAG: hypothetical protein IPL38_14285 [Rhodobacter sp.]|jgi:hypothetical protein|nr:hypothetical protein [Rhodobacter sp.]MBK8440605.1 hypothetical protein [Rhodobacter sp.]